MKAKSFVNLRFAALTGLFCACLIVSNIIAGKLFVLPFGIVLTCGALMFPIVYIIGDVVPEVYGNDAATFVIWMGFALNLLAVIMFTITLKVSFPAYWQNQSSFDTVLGFTPRLLLASFVAYLAGTFLNAKVLLKIKQMTGYRFLWVRTIGSTIVGESVDSLIFVLIGFYGVLPNEALPNMIIAQAVFKTAYEVLATPLTYYVVNTFKKYEKVDQYAETVSEAAVA